MSSAFCFNVVLIRESWYIHCSSRKFCQMFCILHRELLSMQIKSPSFKTQTGQVTFSCFLNIIMKKRQRGGKNAMFFSESAHKHRSIFPLLPKVRNVGEICFVGMPMEHEKVCWKGLGQGTGTNLRIAFSLKKGYLLEQYHARHDWAAQTMTQGSRKHSNMNHSKSSWLRTRGRN